MTTSALSLRSTCRSLASGWQAFFHAPCDARVCAAVRIAFAIVVLVDLAALYPNLDLWFTAGGVLPSEASHQVGRPYGWSVLWLLPDSSAAVHWCYWIAVVQAILLLVGVLPNLQVLCLFVWLTSLENRNFLILDGEDVVFRLLAFCLIWMPIGRCWSVDALAWRWWRAKGSGVDCGKSPSIMEDVRPQTTPDPLTSRSPYAAPGWGLRLLQIQMCVMLLSAGLWKLSGESWLDGTALYYVARLDDYFGRLPIPTWLFDSPWAVALMTWSVLLVELLAPVLIWFRETRRLALVTVVLFHLANEWTMHLFLFHWVMLAGWLSFVSPDDFAWLSRLASGGRKPTEAPRSNSPMPVPSETK